MSNLQFYFEGSSLDELQQSFEAFKAQRDALQGGWFSADTNSKARWTWCGDFVCEQKQEIEQL